MTRPKPRYRPGDRIANRYQVHQVKMGGMGEVYLCLDLEKMVPYALKTFQQRHQSDALRQAFETETATWVALERHPNIVCCFRMETLENQPFMFLEWVSGEEGRGTDLRYHLRSGPIDLKRSLSLILDLCYGLQHAQDKQPGLVHRDLKPENILITQGGQAKITDFGLAQVVAASELALELDTLTSSPGQTMMSRKGIAGTPSYMAPEQWRGETLDQRTDIYALACIWVELLTAQPPFNLDYQPNTPQGVDRWLSDMRHQHEQAKRPDLVAALPDGIIDLIQACLAQDPAERPDSLTQLIDQVQGVYQSLIGQAPPPPPSPDEMTFGDYNDRGITYDALGELDKALIDFKHAINLDPSFAKAYYNRGTTYKALGELDKALIDYNHAINLDPSDALAYVGRGITYGALGELDKALIDFNHAINLYPSFATTYYNRGIAYAALGELDKALIDYNQAINLDPSFAKAYYNRGITYKALGELDKALIDFNQAINLDPSKTIAYLNRGKTYDALGELDKTLIDFNQAISLDPSDANAYLNMGALLGNQGKFDEALPYFEKAAQLGAPTGTQYAAQARQMLEQSPEPETNPALEALEAFAQAASLDDMRQVVTDHSILLDAEFVDRIAQVISKQIPAAQQPAYRQHLTWLQQIIQEQS